MDYFELILKMFKTFHLFHHTLLDDLKSIKMQDDLNKTHKRVLMYLYRDGENIMSSLCKKLRLERGSMTSVIDTMFEKGLVERKRCATDRRKLYIRLTEKGKEDAKELERKWNTYLKEKLKNLSAAEIKKIDQSLDGLQEIYQKIADQGGNFDA